MTRTFLWGLGFWVFGVSTVGCGDDTMTPGTGGAGGEGGEGNGGSKICDPNILYPCYTGDPTTEGRGICHGGTAACNADGTFGECMGEVLPGVETCLTPEDEDCDGPSNEEGEGCVCVPAQQEVCYSGPEGTVDVGQCKAGTRLCEASGTMWSSCGSEVTPDTEDCASPADEDCSGAGSDGCSGDPVQSALFLGNDVVHVTDVVATADGGTVVVGGFEGTFTLGATALISAGGEDIFVAKLDATNGVVWATSFGDAAEQRATGVALNGTDLWVSGNMEGTVDFGGGALGSAGLNDFFVLSMDQDGNHAFSQRYGDAAEQRAADIAVTGLGDVIITGSAGGVLDIGLGAMFAQGEDVFVAKFTLAGTPTYGMVFGDVASQRGTAIGVGAAGNYFIAATIDGTLSFGGPNLIGSSGGDVAVAAFNAGNIHTWSLAASGSGADVANRVAVDSVGRVVVAGTFTSSVDFGLGALNSSGARDVFVVQLSAAGQPNWNKRHGDDESEELGGLAIRSGDIVSIAGAFPTEIDFGGGPAVSAGGTDAFVATFGSGGVHQWSRRFGGSAAQGATAMTATLTGALRVVGLSDGDVDFGDGLLSGDGDDLFVLDLAP